jgi:hypothetical protein
MYFPSEYHALISTYFVFYNLLSILLPNGLRTPGFPQTTGIPLSLPSDAAFTAGFTQAQRNAFACTGWRDYLDNRVTTQYGVKIVNAVYVATVSAVSGSEGPALRFPDLSATTMAACFEDTAADAVVKAMLNREDLSTVCDGQPWVVKGACSAPNGGDALVPVVCVGQPSCSCDGAHAQALTVAPCSSATDAGGLDLLQIAFRELKSPPEIANIALPASQQRDSLLVTISIVPARRRRRLATAEDEGEEKEKEEDGGGAASRRLQAGSEGLVLCNAYALGSPLPSSVQEFGSNQGEVVNNVAVVFIANRSPSTTYRIFCATQSAEFISSAYSTILASSKAAAAALGQSSEYLETTTDCCKEVTLQQSASTRYTYNKGYSGALQLLFPFRPSSEVTISLVARAIAPTAAAADRSDFFFPPSLVISSTSPALHEVSFGAYAAVTGHFEVVAVFQGPSQGEFASSFSNFSTTTLEVVDPGSAQPAPVLLSASFSANGQELLVSFDSPTDRGLAQSTLETAAGSGVDGAPEGRHQGAQRASWRCDLLLAFTGADQSICRWADKASVAVRFEAFDDDDKPRLGALLSLQADTRMRAECTPPALIAGCAASWPVASVATVVLISAPLEAAVPVINVAGTATLGSCTNLDLDLTLSSGTGGRQWESVTVTSTLLTKKPDGFNTTLAQGLADSLAAQDAHKLLFRTLSHRLLEPGVLYTFAGKVCNFLGSCSKANRVRFIRVAVSATVKPILSITGGLSRNIYLNSSLTVSAEAYTVDCDNNRREDGIFFLFELFSVEASTGTLTLVSGVSSLSRDPSRYLLPAYALASIGGQRTVAGATFQLRVQVLASRGGTQASAEAIVTLIVLRGDVRALIVGGAQRSLRPGTSLTLDASSSNDVDIPDTFGSAAGLVYLWGCRQREPRLLGNCPGLILPSISSAPGLQGESLTVQYSPTQGANRLSEISVNILSADGLRSAQRVVLVAAAAAEAPLITVPAEEQDVAPGRARAAFSRSFPLKLVVSVQSVLPAIARWSLVNDSDPINALATLQPSTKYLDVYVPATVSAPNTLNLVLPAGVLAPLTTYTFRMDCQPIGSDESSHVLGQSTSSVLFPSVIPQTSYSSFPAQSCHYISLVRPPIFLYLSCLSICLSCVPISF